MKYDVIITDAENIFEFDDIANNLIRLDDVSEAEIKHIIDIFGRRGFQVVLFPKRESEE